MFFVQLRIAPKTPKPLSIYLLSYFCKFFAGFLLAFKVLQHFLISPYYLVLLALWGLPLYSILVFLDALDG